MSRVAARAPQLVAIFYRDPGLLVELKRLVAIEASNRGQVVSDTDLTDESLFERLQTDILLRAKATLLVQKYGYLLPEINPESSMSKEQTLQMQERARLRAQYQEEERSVMRQQHLKTLQQENDCTSPSSSSPDCESSVNTPNGQSNRSNTPPQATTRSDVQSSSQANATGAVDNASDANLLGSTSGRTGATSQSPQQMNQFGSDDSQSRTMNGANSTSSEMPTANGQGGAFTAGSANSYDSGFTASSNFSRDQYSPAISPTTSSNPSSVPSSNANHAQGRQRAEGLTASQRLYWRSNPYQNIPSLVDMYLQAAARPPTPERFGIQIFRNGTRDLSNTPMDLPAGPDYVVGPGDGISIDVWGGVVRHFYRVVDREGRVTLPEFAPMLVAGKTLAQLQESIQEALRKQFRNVSADVSLSRIRTIRVYVVGDVMHPGAYDISSLSTPLNALFAAGGPTPQGSLRNLKHYRGTDLIQDVDTYDLLLHGVRAGMANLENGDSIIVPPLGPEITIEGMVRRPAIYELKGENTLEEALMLAGGLLPTAALNHIEIQRVVEHKKETMLSLDIPDNDSANEATKQLESFAVQNGDDVRIFPIAPYNQDAVYLDGYVIRPGKYSFHEGMRLTDLVTSYKDLLPEPAANYAEIIRLTPPDNRPQVQSFNLAAALANPAEAPILQPLDTVLIYGRYDFENAPVVSVLGDVRSPGVYPTAGDIHISDAVHLAGGLAPDADADDAQVFRHQADGNFKVFNVKLSGALDGSPIDNIVMSPRDRLLIHRSAAAVSPATVYIKGDVANPGRYPLAVNMRVADLIRAAGGLQQSADPVAADLTRYEWKGETQIVGKQQQIELASVLSSAESDKNIALHNGDVLAIHERPGWDDLGATITLRGEVVHPGTYGISPGERLSSVVRRAGGFSAAAYPYGAMLTRLEVRRIEERSYADTIQRVREQQTAIKLSAAATSDPDEKQSDESAYVQWQTTLDSLVNNPPVGRVTIQVSSDLRDWANTSRDITVRSGDVLTVPKRPSFVVVQGQVYGPTAISYRPGKSARWYLMRGGGPTNLANKRAIFVIRADGTVIGGHTYLWSDQLGTTLQPGDIVVVPEKALGGPPIWKTILQNAQVLSSIATNALLAAQL